MRLQFSEFLDGVLPSADREALEEHLKACTECRSELDDLRRVVEDVRDLPRATVPADLAHRVMEQIAAPVHTVAKPAITRLWLRVVPAAALILVAVGVVILTMGPETRVAEEATELAMATAPEPSYGLDEPGTSGEGSVLGSAMGEEERPAEPLEADRARDASGAWMDEQDMLRAGTPVRSRRGRGLAAEGVAGPARAPSPDMGDAVASVAGEREMRRFEAAAALGDDAKELGESLAYRYAANQSLAAGRQHGLRAEVVDRETAAPRSTAVAGARDALETKAAGYGIGGLIPGGGGALEAEDLRSDENALVFMQMVPAVRKPRPAAPQQVLVMETEDPLRTAMRVTQTANTAGVMNVELALVESNETVAVDIWLDVSPNRYEAVVNGVADLVPPEEQYLSNTLAADKVFFEAALEAYNRRQDVALAKAGKPKLRRSGGDGVTVERLRLAAFDRYASELADPVNLVIRIQSRLASVDLSGAAPAAEAATQ
jgi:hypothetical protein